MIRHVAEKFNDVTNCKAFIDYISAVDPCRLKYFDETGLKLPDKANPHYRDSLGAEPCVKRSNSCVRFLFILACFKFYFRDFDFRFFHSCLRPFILVGMTLYITAYGCGGTSNKSTLCSDMCVMTFDA